MTSLTEIIQTMCVFARLEDGQIDAQKTPGGERESFIWSGLDPLSRLRCYLCIFVTKSACS